MNNSLTIGIVSYNRPKELLRCLESLLPLPDNVTVIISDDASPKREEIHKNILHILNNYSNIYFYSNDINLGYDRNLYKLFEISSTTHLFLLSDDDYLEKDSTVELVKYLNSDDLSCGFIKVKEIKKKSDTPGDHKTILFRDYHKHTKFTSEEVVKHGSHIYNSILFSGLIFKREEVLSLKHLLNDFFKSIYIQVAIFILVSLNSGSTYIEGPCIIVGADGENGFGLNDASKGVDDDLKDRSNILSNLSYHKRLIFVINKLSILTNHNINSSFYKEYKLRNVKAMFLARFDGRNSLSNYWFQLKQLEIPNMNNYYVLFLFVYILPKFILRCLLYILQNTLLYFRSVFNFK